MHLSLVTPPFLSSILRIHSLLDRPPKETNLVLMSSDAGLCVDCEKLPWDQLFKSDSLAARFLRVEWRIPTEGKCHFCTILRKM